MSRLLTQPPRQHFETFFALACIDSTADDTNGLLQVVQSNNNNAGSGPYEVVELEERQWLPRHLRGDPNAFGELLVAYQRPVYSYLVRCGISGAMKDDLFQDIFLKIHSTAQLYKPGYPLKPWLFTIAANTVRNAFRSQRSQVTWDELHQDLPDPDPPVDRQLDAQEKLNWLDRAIPRLPVNQREVLCLVVLEGLALQVVAEVLDMPLGTVKTNLRRARLNLAQSLASRNEPTGGPNDRL